MVKSRQIGHKLKTKYFTESGLRKNFNIHFGFIEWGYCRGQYLKTVELLKLFLLLKYLL